MTQETQIKKLYKKVHQWHEELQKEGVLGSTGIPYTYIATNALIDEIERKKEKFREEFLSIKENINRGFEKLLFKTIKNTTGINNYVVKISKQNAINSKKLSFEDIKEKVEIFYLGELAFKPQLESYLKKRFLEDIEKLEELHNKYNAKAYQVHTYQQGTTYKAELYIRYELKDKFTIPKKSGLIVGENVELLELKTIRKERKDKKKPILQLYFFGQIVDIHK